MRENAEDLVFPHKCIGCRKILNVFDSEYDKMTVYCKNCRAKWERSKILPCSDCRHAAIECSCVPELIENLTVVSLFKFGTVLEADRLVYSVKRRRLPRVYKFAADELANRMLSYCRENVLDLSNAVVTFVPRSKRSIARYGFDHGKLLAETVAERLGMSCAALLRRNSSKGRDQKKLSAAERIINASHKFDFLKNSDIKGMTVLIVDDVITTGATVGSCAGALYEGDPEKIIVLCLAKSDKVFKKK